MLVALTSKALALPLPIYLAGYADRKEPALNIHDELYARVLMLSDGDNNLAVISYDMLGMDVAYDKKIKHAIKTKIKNKIPNLTILLHTVHTHAAPGLSSSYDCNQNDTLYNEIVEVSCTCLLNAFRNLAECDVAYNAKEVKGIGANRRNNQDIKQTMLRSLVFKEKESGSLVNVVNFNCHPTVLSSNNLEVSKDYQGACITALEQIQGIPSIFLQGGCGDISTRFTRNAQNFSEVDRLGLLLSEAVIENINDLQFTNENKLHIKNIIVEANLRKFKNINDYDIAISKYNQVLKEYRLDSHISSNELRIYETAFQGLQIERDLASKITTMDSGISVTIVTFGEFAMVFMPCELFSVLQEQICDTSVYANTMFIGYTSGLVGYIPDIESVKFGGYEVTSSRYEYGTGELLVKQITEELIKIKNE